MCTCTADENTGGTCRQLIPHTHTLTVMSSTSERKRWLTETRASSGHSWNQSMLVQFTRAGNLRARTLRVDPTGEKQSTTWTSVGAFAELLCACDSGSFEVN